MPAALQGPRVPGSSGAASGSMRHIGGGTYEQEFTDDGRPADCWVFEDLVYIHKRHVAAVGYSRDEMTMTPMTYDEMRPGCYDRTARIADMTANHVDVSLCFPTFPRFCGQTFTEAADRELGEACVYAYNDWMVEEWCGESDGHLIPLIIVPLWDARPRRRRGAPQRRAGRACRLLQRDPAAPRPAEHPLGLLGPVLRGVCRDADRGLHAHRLVVADAGHLARCARRGRRDAVASTTRWRASRDLLFSGVLVRFPELRLAYTEGQIGWIPYILERADDVWSEHRAWGGVADVDPRAAVHLLLPPGLRLLLPRPARPRQPRRRSASTTSPSRPTTPTPTRPGRTPRRWPRKMMGRPARGRAVQDPAGQRDPHAVAGSGLSHGRLSPSARLIR